MPRTTSKQSTPSLDQIVAAVVAAMQGQTTEAPAAAPAKGKRSSGKTSSPVQRRVKPENEDRAASGKAVQGAFFEAFQVIYGEKLTGWPTMGDIQAIRDDLQQRIAAQ